jgi:hypothetical protein
MSVPKRSCNLGGALNFYRRATGGTEVRFVFLPDYAGLSGFGHHPDVGHPLEFRHLHI